MDQQVPATRVLLIDRNDCPDNKICPAVIEIDGLTGYKGMVTRAVTHPVTDPNDPAYIPPQVAISDPDLAEKMRPHVGPGEVATLVPDSTLTLIRGA